MTKVCYRIVQSFMFKSGLEKVTATTLLMREIGPKMPTFEGMQLVMMERQVLKTGRRLNLSVAKSCQLV